MANTIVLSIAYLIGVILILAFNELVYRRFGTKGEITRKFAHFTTTLAVVPFPYIFPSHWYVLVLSVFFSIALFVTHHFQKLKSIHDINRKSVGSYLLPLSIYLTFFISFKLNNKFIFILPMLILAVCDPMAAILGMNVKKNNRIITFLGIRTKKTYIGSGGFFISAFVISIIAFYFHCNTFDLKTFLLALSVAAAGTVAELFSLCGSDNLTIPLSVVLVLVLFL